MAHRATGVAQAFPSSAMALDQGPNSQAGYQEGEKREWLGAIALQRIDEAIIVTGVQTIEHLRPQVESYMRRVARESLPSGDHIEPQLRDLSSRGQRVRLDRNGINKRLGLVGARRIGACSVAVGVGALALTLGAPAAVLAAIVVLAAFELYVDRLRSESLRLDAEYRRIEMDFEILAGSLSSDARELRWVAVVPAIVHGTQGEALPADVLARAQALQGFLETNDPFRGTPNVRVAFRVHRPAVSPELIDRYQQQLEDPLLSIGIEIGTSYTPLRWIAAWGIPDLES